MEEENSKYWKKIDEVIVFIHDNWGPGSDTTRRYLDDFLKQSLKSQRKELDCKCDCRYCQSCKDKPNR